MPNRRAILILLVVALPVLAQTDKAKPASIEGTVTNSVTGAPVPRAHIALMGSARYTATSGADGRFSITGIVPGSYVTFAERVGFAPSSARSRVSIALNADDIKTGVEIKLAPTGAISGRVTDADGEPLQGMNVVAKGPLAQESAIADEKGQFRIGGLPAGKYRVKASASGDTMGDGRPEIRTDGTAEVHYASTWYPGVVTEKEAGPVVVQPGTESAGTEIRLVRLPFVRVSGNVVGMPANEENVQVVISHPEEGTWVPIKKDGAFEIWRLDPGKYSIGADWQAPNGEQFQTAAIDIEVGGSNIDNIELRFIPPSDIAGRLEFEDDKAAQVVGKALPGPLLQLIGRNASPTGTVDAGGTFHIAKVPADKYRVTLASGEAYVKSMRLGSQAIDGSMLDLSNGAQGADLTVTVSAAMGSISGTVQDEKGDPAEAEVYLMTGDRDAGFSRGLPAGLPAKPDGTYMFDNLPPGTYRLVAVEGRDDADAYEDAAETVELGAGAKATKDLKRQTPSNQ